MKNKNKLEVATQAGLLTAKYYDDGIAEGIQISLGGDIIAMIDVYKEENAECRVITYKLDHDEPHQCISVNRN